MHGQRSGLLVAHAAWQHSDLIALHDHFFGIGALLVARKIRPADDPLAELQLSHLRAELDHLARKILPHDEGTKGPHERTHHPQRPALAHLPVHGVHTDRMHLHANLMRTNRA